MAVATLHQVWKCPLLLVYCWVVVYFALVEIMVHRYSSIGRFLVINIPDYEFSINRPFIEGNTRVVTLE